MVILSREMMCFDWVWNLERKHSNIALQICLIFQGFCDCDFNLRCLCWMVLFVLGKWCNDCLLVTGQGKAWHDSTEQKLNFQDEVIDCAKTFRAKNTEETNYLNYILLKLTVLKKLKKAVGGGWWKKSFQFLSCVMFWECVFHKNMIEAIHWKH